MRRMLSNFEMRIFRRDVRHIDIYIYIEKISIEHTSVGLASARPNYCVNYKLRVRSGSTISSMVGTKQTSLKTSFSLANAFIDSLCFFFCANSYIVWNILYIRAISRSPKSGEKFNIAVMIKVFNGVGQETSDNLIVQL